MGLRARALGAVPATSALVLACAALALSMAGCGGSEGGAGSVRSGSGEFPGDVAHAESTFHPSDYGIETWADDTLARQPSPPIVDSVFLPSADAGADTVPGFRVQVAITQDIDAAASLKDSLMAAFPDQWVYVVHHPPYYKVRLGDFGERHLAAALLDGLKRRYPDAWIVPDRVLRTPPPKPIAADSTAAADTLR